MFDPRIEKLAKLMVNYSVRLKKGEWAVIYGPANAEPLLKALELEALKVGANVTLRVTIPDASYLLFRNARPEQLRFVAPTDLVEVEKADALIFVRGGWNLKELTSIDAANMSIYQTARKTLLERRLQREAEGKLRWVLTNFPTDALAQEAAMSRIEYEEFVFGAGLLNKPNPIQEWQKISKRQQRLIAKLNRLSTIRIVGTDTDITFGVRGRKWANCDGHNNFPDGEVFTGPEEDKTEGFIRYTYPAIYQGKEVENIRLVFKKGKVVEMSADKGADILRAMVNTDEGAKRVGELAFGTNYSIKRFTKDILFDEKIGGTVHVALGTGYPKTGSKNRSVIHWDMVCDTRKGFTVYGDGKPIMKDGRFLI
ncbi:MAG: aminopeptidase [candidate division WOR-3 bacterium]|jgi:aminopeptidase|nr:aminopeptidase [candidate division WOR-3 bacterium]MCR4424227.1 aminopeptidase [candidate division WOR-3 bacterium]MDH7519355.1 aminopeptidase [bacterium]